MSEEYVAVAGEYPYEVTCRGHFLGPDLVVSVSGGTHPHIGAIALGSPRPSLKDPEKISANVSVISVPGHKDDIVARAAVQRLTPRFGCEVSVSCGIHVDEAEHQDLTQLQVAADAAIAAFADKVASARRASWSDEEDVILVDADENVLGTMPRKLAHTDAGTLHYAFEVLLVDGEGRIAFCRRSALKKLFGGHLSGTCAGHPLPDEPIDAAAERRLTEEVGVEADLTRVGHFIYNEESMPGRSENEFCVVFIGRYDDELRPRAEEISEVVYLNFSQYQELLASGDDRISPWTKAALEVDGIEARIAEIAKA